MSIQQNKKDSVIAAVITFFVVLVILFVLLFTNISYDAPEQLANDSTPELMLDEEETFLEPEILKDLGEEDAVNNEAPAKAFQGEPEPAPKESNKIVEPGKNANPAPPVKKLVSTNKESDVKTTEPKATEEERQRVTSAMAKGFVGKNGNTQGSTGSDGAGDSSVGIVGNASGRTFKGCPKPDVTLRHKTTVTVSVVIDADGKVISATASGAADANIRAACERAARQARWTEKKGAGETRGTLTFTITPR